MSKRRLPVDPFGLSLLDALTNALGGVILLMLIVGATLRGLDVRKLGLDPEGAQGSNYSVRTFKVKKDKLPEPDLMLMQIDMGKSTLTPSLSSNVKGSYCTLSKRQGSGRNEWLVVRNGLPKKNWSVFIEGEVGTVTELDSVIVLITHRTQPLCNEPFEKIILRPNRRKELIKVIESKTNAPPRVFVLNRPCKL